METLRGIRGKRAVSTEDLPGIRERRRVGNPHKNRMGSLRSRGDSSSFVQYEAAPRGIAMVEVPALHSSPTCAICKARREGRGEVFIYTPCGRVAQAEVNAAGAIAARRAAVSRPEWDRQESRNAS